MATRSLLAFEQCAAPPARAFGARRVGANDRQSLDRRVKFVGRHVVTSFSAARLGAGSPAR
jgi:hypothetical protein